MYFRVQTDQAHQKRRPGTGMTEDEELLAWKKLFDLRYFPSVVIAGTGLRFFFLGSPLSKMRADVLIRVSNSIYSHKSPNRLCPASTAFVSRIFFIFGPGVLSIICGIGLLHSIRPQLPFGSRKW
jgi:hypothetical protein